MDFMNKITQLSKKVSEGVVDTYKVVADKTGGIVEETKSKMSINDKNSEITDIYESMGKTVYDMYLQKEDVGKVFKAECKKIDNLQKEILDINTRILFNKNLRTCLNCNEVIALDSAFCENCGTKQKKLKLDEKPKESVKEEEEVSNVCPHCGTVCGKDSKFCSKCGYEMNK